MVAAAPTGDGRIRPVFARRRLADPAEAGRPPSAPPLLVVARPRHLHAVVAHVLFGRVLRPKTDTDLGTLALDVGPYDGNPCL